jgi:hypothetical protein
MSRQFILLFSVTGIMLASVLLSTVTAAVINSVKITC